MVKIILINQHLLTPQESPVSYCALNPSCDLHEGNTYLKGISIEKIQWRRNRRGSAEMREWKRISLLRMSNILLRQFSVHCQSGNAICFPWSGLLVMLQRVVQVNLTEKCESRSSPAALFLLQGPTTWILVGSFSDPFTHPAKCTLQSTATFSQNRQSAPGTGWKSCFYCAPVSMAVYVGLMYMELNNIFTHLDLLTPAGTESPLVSVIYCTGTYWHVPANLGRVCPAGGLCQWYWYQSETQTSDQTLDKCKQNSELPGEL